MGKSGKKNKFAGVHRGDGFNVDGPELIRVIPGFNVRRKGFDPESLESLMDSLRVLHQITPLLVRKRKLTPEQIAAGEPPYDLICGERRHRAFTMLHALGEKFVIKVIPITCTDEQATLLMLEENLQRENLTPSEEADGVARLLGWNWDYERIARELNKSRTWVEMRAKFLQASPELRAMIDQKDVNGRTHRFDVVADVAGAVEDAEQVKVLTEIEDVAWAEAQERTRQRGRPVRPNVRKAANQVLGRKVGRLGVKDVKAVIKDFQERTADKNGEKLFSASDVLAALMIGTGEVSPAEFLEMLGNSLSHRGKPPIWWSREKKSDQDEKTPAKGKKGAIVARSGRRPAAPARPSA